MPGCDHSFSPGSLWGDTETTSTDYGFMTTAMGEATIIPPVQLSLLPPLSRWAGACSLRQQESKVKVKSGRDTAGTASPCSTIEDSWRAPPLNAEQLYKRILYWRLYTYSNRPFVHYVAFSLTALFTRVGIIIQYETPPGAPFKQAAGLLVSELLFPHNHGEKLMLRRAQEQTYRPISMDALVDTILFQL